MTNLLTLIDDYSTDAKCRELLERLRWPDGIACPRCGSKGISSVHKRPVYDCNDCRHQFSVTSGTIMHDSHLPLRKWFMAIYLMCESKKGISSLQLHRTLGIARKTAWYLGHRIRSAMGNEPMDGPTLLGVVEVDETLIGGKRQGRGHGYRFSQIWVVRSDRLGRDAFELLRIWRVFESIGISLRATDENIDDPFYFDIHAVIAANERRKFLERSAEGMNRAAKEGRYTGGIVPLGYSISGDRGFRRLVPDDSPMWAGLSAADVVRRIYDHLAVDGWSCVRIATEFNSLGVPTSYRRDGRGVRGKRTQGLWRSGRIRNLVVNPVYRGLLQYGRRSSRPNGREVISASVSPLVSEDVWDAAIATLKRNRALPRNSCHSYLLRSLIRCAVCGLSFCGTWTRGPRYRCNGSMAHRGQFSGKCIGASIKGEKLEAAVWSDVYRFLTDPDELTDELLADDSDAENHAIAEAGRDSLIDARDAAQLRRKRAIDLYTRGKLSEVEFDAIAADVERELKTLNDRLAVLEPDDDVADDGLSEHVLAEIRERLEADLSDAERREIVRLLVRRITVHTTVPDRGRKQVRVVIDYRFPPGGAARTGIAASSSYNLSRVIVA